MLDPKAGRQFTINGGEGIERSMDKSRTCMLRATQ